MFSIQTLFLSILLLLSSSTYAVKSLKEQAAQAYFSSRPLFHIKHDLATYKLNSELQELLVPLVTTKYRTQLEPRFSKTIKLFTGHTGSVHSVAFNSDGQYALTGSTDTTARLWDLESGQTIEILKGHTQAITAVAFSPDGKYALTGSQDKTARLWDLRYHTHVLDLPEIISKIKPFAIETPCTLV